MTAVKTRDYQIMMRFSDEVASAHAAAVTALTMSGCGRREAERRTAVWLAAAAAGASKKATDNG